MSGGRSSVVSCRARLTRVARAGVSVAALAGLWSGAAIVAGAQGTDTTHHVSHDSTAVALPDTTHGGSTSSATPPIDSIRAAFATTTHDTGSGPQTGSDSTLQRVRSLVAQGQTTAARQLVDSLLAATPPGSMAYASVLYTRATLATNADSAEGDYRRVSVEYAASPRAADALLRLAQLELARGERTQAAAHLDRLTREQLPNQTGISFARTELQVGLAYFDLQDPTHACAALVAAHAAAPMTDVELRNRIDYNAQRCPAPATAGPTADTTHVAGGRAATDSLAKKLNARGVAAATRPAAKTKPVQSAAGKPATASTAATTTAAGRRLRAPGFTVQVAAYQTHTAAAALVERLRVRGYVARIFGTAAPFRVRVGRFATEAQADSAAHSLKGKGITGFVTAGEAQGE